jgi:hypothetical protein
MCCTTYSFKCARGSKLLAANKFVKVNWAERIDMAWAITG